ncbi:MAG: hypothetical protein KJZ73_09770 [Pseudorhodoplanes sp.]|nr:hypothetical protein [Pseudorhodoplanes sp.]MBW7949007.1 hypothetical protein [Pseudorhodoplanes sp.]MCL4711523.1 hypothetical protein [Pseudorhodoplanes sp.]GIK81197.1 MAG: hypothetical protein BroJett024_23020 [Alphaproteobacteria bacterium]
MLAFVSGLAIVGIAVGAALYFKPRDGRLWAMPFVEMTIAVTITIGLAAGMALMVVGLFFR